MNNGDLLTDTSARTGAVVIKIVACGSGQLTAFRASWPTSRASNRARSYLFAATVGRPLSLSSGHPFGHASCRSAAVL